MGSVAQGLDGGFEAFGVVVDADDRCAFLRHDFSRCAADRVGETVEVLVEESVGDGQYEGRAAHQAPDVDGSTTLLADRPLAPGDLVTAQVVDSIGADLVARA